MPEEIPLSNLIKVIIGASVPVRCHPYPLNYPRPLELNCAWRDAGEGEVGTGPYGRCPSH